MSSKKLYYVSFQLGYVSGDPIPAYSPPRLQLVAGDKESSAANFLQTSGWKQKATKSGCENPPFTGTLGKGSSLPSCAVVSLDKADPPTGLAPPKNPSAKDPQPEVSWPVTVVPRR